MPKMKTNRGARKRFRFTGSGKVRRNKSLSNHFLTKKTTKRKRKLRQSTLVSASDERRIKKLLPYG